MRQFGKLGRNAYLYLTTLGIALLIFGVLLLIMPELLAYLISFFFIFVGLILVSFGWKIRRAEQNIRHTVEEVGDVLKEKATSFKDTFDQF